MSLHQSCISTRRQLAKEPLLLDQEQYVFSTGDLCPSLACLRNCSPRLDRVLEVAVYRHTNNVVVDESIPHGQVDRLNLTFKIFLRGTSDDESMAACWDYCATRLGIDCIDTLILWHPTPTADCSGYLSILQWIQDHPAAIRSLVVVDVNKQHILRLIEGFPGIRFKAVSRMINVKYPLSVAEEEYIVFLRSIGLDLYVQALSDDVGISNGFPNLQADLILDSYAHMEEAVRTPEDYQVEWLCRYIALAKNRGLVTRMGYYFSLRTC